MNYSKVVCENVRFFVKDDFILEMLFNLITILTVMHNNNNNNNNIP